jgi:hypothetical protein
VAYWSWVVNEAGPRGRMPLLIGDALRLCFYLPLLPEGAVEELGRGVRSGRAILVVAAPWVYPLRLKPGWVCYFFSTRPSRVALIAKLLVDFVGIYDAEEHPWLEADRALDTAPHAACSGNCMYEYRGQCLIRN